MIIIINNHKLLEQCHPKFTCGTVWVTRISNHEVLTVMVTLIVTRTNSVKLGGQMFSKVDDTPTFQGQTGYWKAS